MTMSIETVTRVDPGESIIETSTRTRGTGDTRTTGTTTRTGVGTRTDREIQRMTIDNETEVGMAMIDSRRTTETGNPDLNRLVEF